MSKCVNLRAEAQALLETNILRFWQTRMVDNERGGFYGRIDGHNTLHPDAPKGAVLNARILWSFAAAARVLHNTPYRILAARAYDYLMQRFIDREHGGVYWSLHADGTPLDTKKQTYAIAFAIYGLAEYVRLTNNQEALDAAIRLFEDLEAHAFYISPSMGESEGAGYVEALTQDWQPIADMRLSDKDENCSFSMNTHLHVLEAYTNLYRVWQDKRVEQRLRLLIHIFATYIFDPVSGHLHLFFDEQWQPITTSVINHTHHFSPGHDIEAAWLLREAQAVLEENEEVNKLSRRLAVAARDGIMKEKQWWCYAEAVVGYIDQWQDIPDPHYLNLANAAWDFIVDHLVDHEHGEWYWAILPDGTPDRTHDKAGFWKCPYHNSRMCFELLERL